MTDFVVAHRRSLALATLSEVPSVLRLAVPIVVGLTSGTLIGMIDTLMVAPLGTDALAALGLATSALIILYSGIFGLLSVTNVRLARTAGAQDWPKLSETFADGQVLAAALGLLAGLVMLVSFPAFALLGITTDVRAQLWPYWAAMAVSLVPYALLGLYRGLFNALERPWVPVWIVLVGVALNVPLNWILIHGIGTLHGLGIAGAGLASLLAKSLSLFLLWRFGRALPMPGGRSSACANPARAFRLVREGWPAALSSMGEGGSYAVAGLMMAFFGSVALAANQVVHSIALVMYMLPMGMSAAVSLRVGQAMGSGQTDRVRAVGLAASLSIAVWMGAVTGMLLLFRHDLAAALSTDPHVVLIASAMFLALAITQVADGMQSTAQGALRGLLDIKTPTAITLTGCWLFALPLAYVAAVWLGLGAVGVWIGYGTGVLVVAVTLQVRFVARTKGLTPLAHHAEALSMAKSPVYVPEVTSEPAIGT